LAFLNITFNCLFANLEVNVIVNIAEKETRATNSIDSGQVFSCTRIKQKIEEHVLDTDAEKQLP
jgi:hypothetical protein